MHLKRWITSLIGLPLLIIIVSKGGFLLFTAFVAAACVVALWEYSRISFGSVVDPQKGLFLALSIITGLVIVGAAYARSSEAVVGALAINLLLAALISLPQYKSDHTLPQVVAQQVMGTIYIPLFLSFLVLIRNSPDGIIWIFLLFFIVFAGDTGAYYAGSYWGRRKLCPAVSPGKTIEGAIGGLLSNVGVGALLKAVFLPILPWGPSILFFLCVGVVGQVGDLFESELKRTANIKDSGGILPGHGGVLDRIDALLFAAPVAYFFKLYILS